MDRELRTYNFNNNPVRVLGTQDEPIFVAKDVALILGYSDTSAMVRYLDDDERGTCQIDSPSGVQNFVTITESGLYSAIMRSTLPTAKAFKKWVTSEVLPSIRKHGMYATPATAEAIISDPDVMINVLKALKEERIAKVNAQLEAKEAQKEKEQAQNQLTVVAEERDDVTLKLDVVTSAVKPLFIEKSGTVTIRDCAKYLSTRGWNLSESTLRKTMQEKGWLTKGKGPTATAWAVTQGYLAAGVVVKNHVTGWEGEVKTPKITSKGLIKITSSLRNWGYNDNALKDFDNALDNLIGK